MSPKPDLRLKDPWGPGSNDYEDPLRDGSFGMLSEVLDLGL